MTSSQELHPVSGARFVCEREGPSIYRYAIYAAGGATHLGALRWDEDGKAVADPPCPDAWAHGELLKLARVLKHGQQTRLTRWRGP